jgi:hypothetical protein
VLIGGEARKLRISYTAGNKYFHGYADSLDDFFREDSYLLGVAAVVESLQ